MINSPISKFTFKGRSFLIKRDDLLDDDFSGNKARKFYYYFLYLKNNPHIDTIISYGSNQSNAMYSLSVLAKLFNITLRYYTHHVSSYLKTHPIGNYKHALLNGAVIIEDAQMVKRLKNGDIDVASNELFIKEGGANVQAEYGIKLLADELRDYQDYNIFLPSGTGVTALYLQKHTKAKVYTCSCVGDDEYLKQQWSELEATHHPAIIKKHKKFHFGKLYRENYEMWLELKKAGIEFDLLYDSIGWQVVMNNLDILGDKVIYIHQGGIRGNESMIQRYQQKYKEHS
ncbi:MAG: 1-aminocyclopropane-1-carboxylate deaminase [Epsilonproteobacteria bacterium]|nr:1-aminocyclopropane-1-carboxylate deaminase [Campylobacterota bacterium]